MKKTPLELAANDHIKELIIAYCAPQYMPDEDAIKAAEKKRYTDTRVNKQGLFYHPVEYDPPLEKPMSRKKSAVKKKKTQKEPEIAAIPQ